MRVRPFLFLSAFSAYLAVFEIASNAAVFSRHAHHVVSEAEHAIANDNPLLASEFSLRKWEGEIRAELATGLHRLEYQLKHRRLLIDELIMAQSRIDTA